MLATRWGLDALCMQKGYIVEAFNVNNLETVLAAANAAIGSSEKASPTEC
jgi:fructose/tagatose bisphosphate aldolase